MEERPEFNEGLSPVDLLDRHSRGDKERRQWNSKRFNVGTQITLIISVGPCSGILIGPGCSAASYTAQNSLHKTKNDLAQNVNRVKAEKPCARGLSELIAFTVYCMT